MVEDLSHQWPGVLRQNPRTYTPSDGETEGGTHSHLSESVLHAGDWSWKPIRNKQFLQGCMPRFMGVPPSAAELYGRRPAHA